MKKERKRKNIRKYMPLYIMMLPGVLYLLINNYIPMVGIVIAFKNIKFKKSIFDTIIQSEWVGLDNFKYLFQTKDAFIITRNTLLYNLTFILLGTAMAVMVAILLNDLKNRHLSRYFQSALLLPHLISMVIVSYLVFAFLSTETGFINNSILDSLGKDSVTWYTNPKYWPFILVLVNIWKSVGYSCIVYLAAIVGIDPEYYEASSLDGATKLQQIKHITLPLILPVITLMVLLSIGRIFYSDFGLFYQVPLNSGPLYPATNVIDTYVYRALMQLGDISMASATGLYQSFVGFVLIMISNFVVKKVNKESAIF